MTGNSKKRRCVHLSGFSSSSDSDSGDEESFPEERGCRPQSRNPRRSGDAQHGKSSRRQRTLASIEPQPRTPVPRHRAQSVPRTRPTSRKRRGATPATDSSLLLQVPFKSSIAQQERRNVFVSQNSAFQTWQGRVSAPLVHKSSTQQQERSTTSTTTQQNTARLRTSEESVGASTMSNKLHVAQEVPSDLSTPTTSSTLKGRTKRKARSSAVDTGAASSVLHDSNCYSSPVNLPRSTLHSKSLSGCRVDTAHWRSFRMDKDTPYFALLEGMDCNADGSKNTTQHLQQEHLVARMLELPSGALLGEWVATTIQDPSLSTSMTPPPTILLRHKSHERLAPLSACPGEPKSIFTSEHLSSKLSTTDALTISQFQPKRTRITHIESQRILPVLMGEAFSTLNKNVYLSSVSIVGFEGFDSCGEHDSKAASMSNSILRGVKSNQGNSSQHPCMGDRSLASIVDYTNTPIGITLPCQLDLQSDYTIWLGHVTVDNGSRIVAIDICLSESPGKRLIGPRKTIVDNSMGDVQELSERNLLAHTESASVHSYDPMHRFHLDLRANKRQRRLTTPHEEKTNKRSLPTPIPSVAYNLKVKRRREEKTKRARQQTFDEPSTPDSLRHLRIPEIYYSPSSMRKAALQNAHATQKENEDPWMTTLENAMTLDEMRRNDTCSPDSVVVHLKTDAINHTKVSSSTERRTFLSKEDNGKDVTQQTVGPQASSVIGRRHRCQQMPHGTPRSLRHRPQMSLPIKFFLLLGCYAFSWISCRSFLETFEDLNHSPGMMKTIATSMPRGWNRSVSPSVFDKEILKGGFFSLPELATE